MIERKNYCLKEDNICISEDSIAGIPSDDPQNLTKLDILFYRDSGDIGIGMNEINETNSLYIPSMRFRSSNGGGIIPLISEEISIFKKSFSDYKGQIPLEYEKLINSQNDVIKSNSDIKITYGKQSDEFKLIIEGIEADDQEYSPTNFIKIEITNDENVFLTLTNTRFEQEGKMEFKTKENGGQFPIIAKAFTRIAERIANAEKAESFFD